jgi:TetR/AcrR family transcriptional regulator
MRARDKILNGAAKTYGRLGYAHTRVEDVLHDAEVSRPTFYKEFSSADDLFMTLAQIHYAALATAIVGEMQGAAKPGRKLDALIAAYFAWRKELGAFGRVLDSEARNPNSPLTMLRKPIIDGLISAFRAQLVELGRPAPDPLLLRALIAACEQLGDTFPEDRAATQQDLARRQAVMMRLAGAALALEGESTPPMPVDPNRKKRAKKKAPARG